ncbi:hypothetical protein OWV82_001268 [Melia azedarach]|uniref:Uncharacterized protein n=1 Tax=Melia azedarach TaxID=155640 RepID=A0ACC1YXR6_MELAZ|nr:hypothetical protein OWV82_001268 [Melia azedarach]
MLVGINALKFKSMFLLVSSEHYIFKCFLQHLSPIKLNSSPRISMKSVVSKELHMKTFRIINKRIQFLKRWMTMASSRSAITLGNVQRTAPTSCFHKPCFLRQLIRKFKSQWKQALGSKSISTRFSYDIHSYSLNFDDGLFP